MSPQTRIIAGLNDGVERPKLADYSPVRLAGAGPHFCYATPRTTVTCDGSIVARIRTTVRWLLRPSRALTSWLEQLWCK